MNSCNSKMFRTYMISLEQYMHIAIILFKFFFGKHSIYMSIILLNVYMYFSSPVCRTRLFNCWLRFVLTCYIIKLIIGPGLLY